MKRFPAYLLALCTGMALCIRAATTTGSTNELNALVQAASNYQSGQSAEPLRALEEAVRQSFAAPESRKGVERALIKLLAADSSYEAKKFACEQLAIVGSQSALPAIRSLLNEPETASIACFALSTFPPGPADAALREELKWVTGGTRLQIITALGDRRDAKAVDLISKDARSADEPLAEAAISALAKIGTPAAFQVISGLREKMPSPLSPALEDATLRFAGGFAQTGNAKRAKPLYEDLLAKSKTPAVRRTALAALLKLDADGGESRILETLSGPDDVLKPVAIAAIAHVRTPGASERFASEIHHLKPEEQALMIDILAARGDDFSRVALAKALASTEPLTRRAAIVAVGRIGDPYFASMLARSSQLATDPEENRAIESALTQLKGGSETDKRLVAELKTSLPKARVQLIGAVVRRQGAAANPVLLEETDNSDPTVAKAAFRALGKTATSAEAPQVLAKLASMKDAGVRTEAESAAAQVLARIENPGERSAVLREALGKAGNSPETKAALLPLLPACADADSLALTQAAVADAEPQVRDAALRALSEWPDAAAWGPLLECYRQPAAGAAHGLALRGLVRLIGEQNAKPEPGIVNRYRELFEGARSDADLKLILGALAGYAQPDALPLALPLLSHPAVRPEAIVAVRRIAEATKAQNPQQAEDALKRLPNP